MKNKVAAIVTGAMLTLTAGILPSYAINANQSPVSTAGANLEAVNLDNGNDNLLIAQRRRIDRTIRKRKAGSLLPRKRRRRVRKVCRTLRKRVTRNGRVVRTRTLRRICRPVR